MTNSVDSPGTEDLNLYLPEYLEGQLDPPVAARVKAWLEQSEQARIALADLRELMSMDPVATVNPPAALREAFYLELGRLQAAANQDTPRSKLHRMWQGLRARLSLRQLAYGLGVLLIGYWVGATQPLHRSMTEAAPSPQLARVSSEVHSLELQLMQTRLRAPAAEERMRAVRYGSEQLGDSPQLVNALSEVIANDPSTHVRLAAAQVLLNYISQAPLEQRYVELCLAQDDETVQLVMLGMLNEVSPEKAKEISAVLLKQGRLSPQRKQLIHQLI